MAAKRMLELQLLITMIEKIEDVNGVNTLNSDTYKNMYKRLEVLSIEFFSNYK